MTCSTYATSRSGYPRILFGVCMLFLTVSYCRISISDAVRMEYSNFRRTSSSRALCGRLKPTTSTPARAVFVNVRVARCELVASIAVSLSCVDSEWAITSSIVNSLCYGLKMIFVWTNAMSNTTNVVDVQPGRDGSDKVLVGPAMRLDDLAPIVELRVAVVSRSLPKPTTSTYALYVRKESNLQVLRVVILHRVNPSPAAPASMTLGLRP